MTAIQDGKKMQYRGVYEGIVQNIIQFTIQSSSTSDKKTYNAEPGMTWGEWCDSAYNTEGFSPQNYYGYDLIIGNTNGYPYYITTVNGNSDNAVSSVDVIVANKTYYLGNI